MPKKKGKPKSKAAAPASADNSFAALDDEADPAALAQQLDAVTARTRSSSGAGVASVAELSQAASAALGVAPAGRVARRGAPTSQSAAQQPVLAPLAATASAGGAAPNALELRLARIEDVLASLQLPSAETAHRGARARSRHRHRRRRSPLDAEEESCDSGSPADDDSSDSGAERKTRTPHKSRRHRLDEDRELEECRDYLDALLASCGDSWNAWVESRLFQNARNRHETRFLLKIRELLMAGKKERALGELARRVLLLDAADKNKNTAILAKTTGDSGGGWNLPPRLLKGVLKEEEQRKLLSRAAPWSASQAGGKDKFTAGKGNKGKKPASSGGGAAAGSAAADE